MNLGKTKKEENSSVPKVTIKGNRYFLLGFTIIFSFVVFFSFVTLTYFQYQKERANDENYFKKQDITLIDFAKRREEKRLDAVFSDVRLIQSLPAMTEFLADESAERKKRLHDLFLNFSRQRKVYDQIRYLDVNGQEIVRVNYNNGNPSVVSEDGLQNKKGRYYFDDAFSLPLGGLYVSPLDLNIEGSAVEIPFKPMLRVATPLFNQGEKKGVLIINYLAQEIVHELEAVLADEGTTEIFLVNEDGYWLHSKNKNDEWGFMFPEKKDLNLAVKRPDLWNIFKKNSSGQIFLADGLYTFDTLSVDPGISWKVYSFNTRDIVYAASNRIYDRLVLTNIIFLVFLIVVNLIAFFLFRRLDKATEGKERALLDLQKFRLAVDNASDHIVITDREGIVIYGNRAVQRITGYSPEEVLGKKAGVLWRMPMPLEFYKKFWDTIKIKKQVFVGELQNRRKNGVLYNALVSISPVLDNKGEVVFFVGIERDITKEKQVDQAKTEFVSLASHQLRTPLTAISWFAEILLNGDVGKLKPKQSSYIKEIYHSNQRMIELVNALLNVSRLELGTFMIEPQVCDIRKIADEAISELNHRIQEKNIVFNKQYDKRIKEMMLDKKLTMIIFQNLLSNAVKYTPAEGRINLDISVDDKKLLISVSDTGLGIPKEQQDRIFTKLFRADNARKTDVEGTGLGLYMIKSIVEKTGGKVWFESIEGKGTKFFITLPLSGMKRKVGSKSLS